MLLFIIRKLFYDQKINKLIAQIFFYICKADKIDDLIFICIQLRTNYNFLNIRSNKTENLPKLNGQRLRRHERSNV